MMTLLWQSSSPLHVRFLLGHRLHWPHAAFSPGSLYPTTRLSSAVLDSTAWSRVLVLTARLSVLPSTDRPCILGLNDQRPFGLVPSRRFMQVLLFVWSSNQNRQTKEDLQDNPTLKIILMAIHNTQTHTRTSLSLYIYIYMNAHYCATIPRKYILPCLLTYLFDYYHFFLLRRWNTEWYYVLLRTAFPSPLSLSISLYHQKRI